MAAAFLRRIKQLIPNRHPARLAWHRTKSLTAALWYGFPARSLTVIGITGTDGKTTSVGMTAHILHRYGIASGAMSTAFFRVRDTVIWNTTQKTSPSPFTVQKFLRQLVREGCTHAVLEYSSHGLVQGRTDYTWPHVAAITNTSPEHLDYHGNMQQYRADKALLFTMLRGRGVKILNARDDTYEQYKEIPSSYTIAYSADETVQQNGIADHLWLTDVAVRTTGSSATVHRSRDTNRRTLSLPVAGAFNLENALCAIGCAVACGVGIDTAVTALATFAGVPGRMERIDAGQPFAVFVDFTVTPASYERTLATVRNMLGAGKRLLVLTGSCGDRMREKRPQIGKICSKIADVVVVSNEDPYTENPESIIEEVWAGIDHTKTKAQKILDRGEAIRFLFTEAKAGDAVILCGKGSDTTMWIKTGQVPWNEREIARSLLKKLRMED